MPDLVKVRYAHNGKSTKTNEFGMRENSWTELDQNNKPPLNIK
jgi:hypothetical protein